MREQPYQYKICCWRRMAPSRELQRRISGDQDMRALPRSLGGFRGILSTLLWKSSPARLARARPSGKPHEAEAQASLAIPSRPRLVMAYSSADWSEVLGLTAIRRSIDWTSDFCERM